VEANCSTGERFEYQYDAVGNRKTLTAAHESPLRVAHYAHDAANRLTNVDGVTYTYDHNGNLLSDGARTFVYDAANRLTQVVSGTFTTVCTHTSAGVSAGSGDGVRLAQVVNGAATRYVNDVAAPLPQVLSEAMDQRVSAYLYGLGMIGSYESGTWAYHHPDGLGSVRQLSDGDGQVTLARSYTPFGAPLTQAGTAQGSFGFAGKQQDPSTGSGQVAAAGLTFLRARYYDPTTGCFLTRDPLPRLRERAEHAPPLRPRREQSRQPGRLLGLAVGQWNDAHRRTAAASHRHGLRARGERAASYLTWPVLRSDERSGKPGAGDRAGQPHHAGAEPGASPALLRPDGRHPGGAWTVRGRLWFPGRAT
jgi:RHS repeat-associated protein